MFSHLRAHAFARSVTVARSSAVQASSSRRQERRWAIVCGSPLSCINEYLAIDSGGNVFASWPEKSSGCRNEQVCQGRKSAERFEWPNGLDTALHKNKHLHLAPSARKLAASLSPLQRSIYPPLLHDLV